jgi:hypothetical protein
VGALVTFPSPKTRTPKKKKKKVKREKFQIIKRENGCFGIYSYGVCVDLCVVVVVLRLNHDWIGFVVVV